MSRSVIQLSGYYKRESSESSPRRPIRGRPNTPTPLAQARTQHTLETLNADVLRLIALELRGCNHALLALASSCRTLRTLTSPVLFARCRLPPTSIEESPPAIRLHVRLLHVRPTSQPDVDSLEFFERLINSFPSLAAVTFGGVYCITRDRLNACLAHPRIHTLSFGIGTHFPPASPSSSSMLSRIDNLYYIRNFWREVVNSFPGDRHARPMDLNEIFSREAAALSPLVLGMNESAVRLRLSMESAPISSMVDVSWPRLQELSLEGRYLNQAQADSLPPFLSSLSQLMTLSIQICRRPEIGRASILGRQPSPPTALSGLRSLTVAFPDLEDDIFSIDSTSLLHLSLRDCPRYYHFLKQRVLYNGYWAMPILSPSECLSILKRMQAPQLSSLELVYMVDTAGSDDELLEYVAEAYPRLSYLELHRYRRDRSEQVDYTHLARLLTALKSLRTVRLNLDFHDDHGPYCDKRKLRAAWFETFRNERGPEVVGILEDCPYLDYVGLLYHGIPHATWVEFHPARCAEPRFVLEYDTAHVDSEPIPHSWYSEDMLWKRYTTSKRPPYGLC